jgi:asparagine synthase (glutamine-hydrolysing)
MCGICGEVRLDGGSPDTEAIERAMAAMERRGPDAAGRHARGRVAFGHRRLKVIDTSDRSNQPFLDEQHGLCIVFNGAIYNHRELRRELEQHGHRFTTTGDTEVLTKAYAQWGGELVHRLNGMFAFGIHELETGRVFLARDRVGIKPLYVHETPERLRFASSLPALRAAGGVSNRIDEVALHHYLSFHAVVPAPHTILADVRKLPPATTWTLHPDGRREENTYWRLEYPGTPVENVDAVELREELHRQLADAVDRRMVADVPVGVLLSGGLDSSLIVGLLAERLDTGKLETFSIGFESVGDEEGDEFRYSDVIAKRFETKHHKIRVPGERVLDQLDDCFGAMSEPMVSHDNIGFYLLSQEVSKHVTVVQSGQGADEVFAGYFWYPRFLEATASDSVELYARSFLDRDQAEMAKVLRPEVLADDVSYEYVARHFAQPGADRPIDKVMRIDTTTMLVDDPVKRVDNHTMAFGLEARVPFLDHELLEFAARVPGELKVAQGGKGILKDVARDVIPHEVIDRPKGYFPVPALKYLRGAFLDRVRETLDARVARERGLFRREYIDTLFADPESHLTPLRGSKLWQIATLETWLQRHEIG